MTGPHDPCAPKTRLYEFEDKKTPKQIGFSELAELIAGNTKLLVSDISVGAWWPDQLATSLLQQVSQLSGRTWSERSTGNIDSVADRSAVTEIGDWVDAEGRGDSAVIRSDELLRRFSYLLELVEIDGIVIIAPLFGGVWGRENEVFLELFLRSNLLGSDSVMVAEAHRDNSTSNISTPVQRENTAFSDVAQCLPSFYGASGVASWFNSAALQFGLRLNQSETLVIDPQMRVDPLKVPTMYFDRHIAKARGTILEAFVMCHCSPHFVDVWRLCELGIALFRNGATATAALVFERALVCSRSPREKIALQIVKGSLAIAGQEYEKAANLPDITLGASGEILASLLELKGWGLAMSGEHQKARRYLATAIPVLAACTTDPQRLAYSKNILALAEFRCGNHDAALTLEKDIAATIRGAPKVDYRLKYINEINTARLYRSTRRYSETLAHYNEAFGTTRGLRTGSDRIYVDYCLYNLMLLSGKLTLARVHLLRAIINWLALPLPEAIGWRTSSIILGSRPDSCVANPENLSKALHDKATALGLARSADSRDVANHYNPPHFCFASLLDSDSVRAGYGMGSEGWVLIALSTDGVPTIDGSYTAQLRRLAWGCIKIALETPAMRVGLLAIDDSGGMDMGATYNDFMTVVLRWGLQKSRWKNKELQLSHELIMRRQGKMKTTRHPGIHSVRLTEDTSAIIEYKRYCAPKTIANHEYKLLKVLWSGLELQATARHHGISNSEMFTQSRRFERDYLLTMSK